MDDATDAIRRIIEEECRAWAAGDARAFSESISAECVFTNIFGQQFVGRADFEVQHARIFASIYKGSRLDQQIDHIRMIRPDVAIVDTSATLEVPASPSASARTVRTKLLQVFVRDHGQWQIASFHNIEVRPMPAAVPA